MPGIGPANEAARQLHQAYLRFFIFSTVMAIIIVVLNLLGLLGIMRQILSFPVVSLGQTPVTLWIILKAVLILAGFFYVSHLLQAYLDYKVYPAIGVDQGLGYALNTFLKYLMLAIGLLFALNVLGLDLKLLMVFAGAIGIGIGLGMQSIVANVVSGFTLIFGGKLRKGDWIAVQGTTGVVTDIILRATVVRTRDNIEYLIPNSEFITGTLVNYSLGSPLVRVTLPVGVSYSADPRMVERILLAVAEKEPLVSGQQSPGVRFIGYGDSSINFELLFWIDIRKTPIRLVRSELYFAVFEELKKAGIEIPFPQRDLHVRSVSG